VKSAGPEDWLCGAATVPPVASAVEEEEPDAAPVVVVSVSGGDANVGSVLVVAPAGFVLPSTASLPLTKAKSNK